jgi:hypothetical protein
MHAQQSRKPARRAMGRVPPAAGAAQPHPHAGAPSTRQLAAVQHREQRRQHAPRQDGAPWAQGETTFAARRRGRAFRAERAASSTALQVAGWLIGKRRPPPCGSGAPRRRPLSGTWLLREPPVPALAQCGRAAWLGRPGTLRACAPMNLGAARSAVRRRGRATHAAAGRPATRTAALGVPTVRVSRLRSGAAGHAGGAHPTLG